MAGVELNLGGAGATAVVPIVKQGMTNLLSEIHRMLYSKSDNPIFSSPGSTEEQIRREATRLSRRLEVQKFLEVARKSPDLFFENKTDTINQAKNDADVNVSRVLAEQSESVASHNIGISVIAGILLAYTIYYHRAILFK
jgi:predicted trehalose synthase